MIRKKINKKWCMILVMTIISVFFLTSCQKNQNSQYGGQDAVQREFLAMDTYMTFTAYGDGVNEALDKAEQEIQTLEDKWSVTEADSEIYTINHSNGNIVTVSEETANVIGFTIDMAKKTEGALDPTIYPVLTAWGFTTDNYRVPEQEEIQTLLKYVGYEQVEINGQSVRIPEGMELDLGAVGKGYAGDLAATLIEEAGVDSALLSIGGNIQAVGSKPDGSDWRLAIQNPYGDGKVGVLEVSDCAVVTSGNYERYFTADDGTTYGHIIDPETGYPVDNGLASVTIITKEGKKGDALSTAMFVKGLDGASEYWRTHQDFNMIMMTDDKEIYITEEIKEKFTLSDSFKDMDVHIIK